MYKDIKTFILGTPCLNVMGPDFNTYAKRKETKKNGCHISASGGDAIISNMKYLKKTLYCHVQNISTILCVHELHIQ